MTMDKQKKPTQAKYFKYQLSKTMIALAIAVILLCGAGIGVSVYRIVAFGIHGFTDTLQSPFLIGICLLCIVIVVGILVKSQYVVDDRYYYLQFGFVKSKFAISDVTSLELNTTTNKLTVFIGEEYSVLTLNEKWREEFIAALRAVKPQIDFTFTLAETPEK